MRPLLILALFAAPLSAQVRISPGFAVGPAIPMGDLGSISSPMLGGNAWVLARIPGERYAVGLEFQYHQFKMDSVVVLGFDTTPSYMVAGPAWRGYGAMVRYEYDIKRPGLYAVGGAGLYFTRSTPAAEHPVQTPEDSHDFTVLAGLGYRMRELINLEIRVINVFTVNDSQRWLPITVGFRF